MITFAPLPTPQAVSLCLAILLKPSSSVNTLVLVSTPLVYCYLVASSLMKVRQKAVDRLKKEGEHTAHAVLQTSDIVVAAGSGMLLLLCVVGWIILGLGLLNPQSTDPLASLLPTMGTVGAAMGRAKSMLDQKQKQVDSVVMRAETRLERCVGAVGSAVVSGACNCSV